VITDPYAPDVPRSGTGHAAAGKMVRNDPALREMPRGTVHVHAPGCEGLRSRSRLALCSRSTWRTRTTPLTAIWEDSSETNPLPKRNSTPSRRLRSSRLCRTPARGSKRGKRERARRRVHGHGRQAGWDVEFEEADGAVIVKAMRDTEVIEIVWEGKRILHVPQYGTDGRHVSELAATSRTRDVCSSSRPLTRCKTNRGGRDADR